MIIFDNFLDTKLYDILDKKISSIEYDQLEDLFDRSYESKSTNTHECIPLRVHISNEIRYKSLFIERKLLNWFREEINEKLNDYSFNKVQFQFCIWEEESLLQSHRDSIYKYGGTLYLNTWQESWGGLFKYRNKDGEEKVVCPQKNLFVFNNINEVHEVTLTNKNTPEKRKSIQVWMLD